MGARENAALIRRGYAAFSAGDMATLTELFADDIVWNVAGSGGLSGAKQGRDAVFAYFGEVTARSGGTLQIALHDVMGGERHAIGLHHEDAERENRVLYEDVMLVFHIRDGRVTEVWEIPDDPASFNGFWA
jgi:hypothetical protein